MCSRDSRIELSINPRQTCEDFELLPVQFVKGVAHGLRIIEWHGCYSLLITVSLLLIAFNTRSGVSGNESNQMPMASFTAAHTVGA